MNISQTSEETQVDQGKDVRNHTPPEDGISLDGLYPVAAAAEDDDEISFVTSRRYACVRVGGRHGRDT